jgi:hypothetical protein
VEAWSKADVDALRALARFSTEAAEFCAEALPVPVSANGQPAVAYYDRATISEITAFITPATFSRFGLPDELPCAVPARA